MKISTSSLQSSNTVYNNRLKELKLEVLEAQLASKTNLLAEIDKLVALVESLSVKQSDDLKNMQQATAYLITENKEQSVSSSQKLENAINDSEFSISISFHKLTKQTEQFESEIRLKINQIEGCLLSELSNLSQDINASQKALKGDLLALENQLAANSSALLIELEKADKFRKLQAKVLGAIISVGFIAGGLIAWLM